MLFISDKNKEDCIVEYYNNLQIKDNEILLQNSNRSSINGSIYYLLLELCGNKKYKKYKKYFAIKKSRKNYFIKLIFSKKLTNIKLIEYESIEYYKILNRAKYLITNDAFPTSFIKKQGQVYINIVDETSLLCIGRYNKSDSYKIGNKQRNFIMADFIICPNNYTLDVIRKSYMLDNLYNGKYIISSLPKNDIFFDYTRIEKIRKKINFRNSKYIIVYSPLMRSKKDLLKQEENVKELLDYLNTNLTDDYTIFVNINNKTLRLNYEDYDKIYKMPKNFELNEVLSASNVLITDYSNSIFDYLITNNQIISYAYDIKDIKENIGLAVEPTEKLNIKVLENLTQICSNIKSKANYDIAKIFIEDATPNATSEICKILLNESKLKTIDANNFKNNKQNVLLFTGSLIKNGITTSLKGLINNIDLTKRNYYLTFFTNEVKKNKYIINELPKQINYIPIDGEKNVNLKEERVLEDFYEKNIVNKEIISKLKTIYTREINRNYLNKKFDYAIDFCGYNKEIINLFMYMKSIRIRYTHSNLKEEYKTRQNIHLESLKLAYKNYDKIVAVREGMDKEINTHFSDLKPKSISIVHNLNSIQEINNKSKMPIEFQEKTYSNTSIEKLNSILENKDILKFINISRFSKEKGLERLINAFDKFCKQNKLKQDKAYLIIIGGHGKDFENVCNLVKKLDLSNVIIIRNIQNPLSILKKCNAYILSSYYEGLPMTIMEALILDIPTISVDIIGPRKFFKQDYVYLVNDSEDGLIDGMNDYIKDNIKNLKKFDAEEFNKNALKEFEEIF